MHTDIAMDFGVCSTTVTPAGERGWLGFVVAMLTLLLGIAIQPAWGDETPGASKEEASQDTTGNPIGGYFKNWFERVSETQGEQPHWVTPLVTVTPRLEEEIRYDQVWQALPGGHSLISYGGGKGLELIPAEPVEVIIGIPAYQTEDSSPRKRGWTDQSFLLKYRIAAANEDHGNYILTAFMGWSVPNGSSVFTSHHYGFTPTLAFGKGWGRFDFQSTLAVSIPDNGGERSGAGTPVLFNTAFQYHVGRFFWPEVEANYSYWPNGKHEGLNQLFITPGVLLGRIPIWRRVGLTLGAGCQIAVTDFPLMHRNIIFSARVPF